MVEQITVNSCYHCGAETFNPIMFGGRLFCCSGCKGAYRMITAGGLDYVYNQGAVLSRPDAHEDTYGFLNHPEVEAEFVTYRDDTVAKVKLSLPSIHCSSCVWLLENLYVIDNRIGAVEVDMMARRANISYDPNRISLYELAGILTRIGYAPVFKKDDSAVKANNTGFYAKLGVAGFCFGNIMLFSFPEYRSFDTEYMLNFRGFFSLLILALSVPVLLFSAADYLRSAFVSVKAGLLTLDVSIGIGILALYGKSVFDIAFGHGPGYMDSFAGFVFFLLIGKWFQNYTYDHLSFDNKLESYFPLVVFRYGLSGTLEPVKLQEVKCGDVLSLRKSEVIPVDGRARSEMMIDYSFVTGESEPVCISEGERVYTGGRILDERISFEAISTVNDGRLKELWKDSGKVVADSRERFIRRFSRLFLFAVLLLAIGSSVVWLFIDSSSAIFVAISVLIVACPCALALSLPFTVGNASRLLGKLGFYVRNASSIPELNGISTIVFDKTGTITTKEDAVLALAPLSESDKICIYSVCVLSGHPKSRVLAYALHTEIHETSDYREVPGAGIEALVDGHKVKIGSENFVLGSGSTSGSVHVTIDDQLKLVYNPESTVRQGVPALLSRLKAYRLVMLSGDDNRDENSVLNAGFHKENVFFNQTPEDKRRFIDKLRSEGEKVLMVGDGLNDIGALSAADFGIAVTDNIYGFVPKCDAIMEGNRIDKLDTILSVGKRSVNILRWCFVVSLLYNSIGLYFALTGQLSPLIAAVLMPLSSVSVVLLTTISLRKSE